MLRSEVILSILHLESFVLSWRHFGGNGLLKLSLGHYHEAETRARGEVTDWLRQRQIFD
jgi:hypothetical protein